MYRCEAHEKKKVFQGLEPYGARGNLKKIGYLRKIEIFRFLRKHMTLKVENPKFQYLCRSSIV